VTIEEFMPEQYRLLLGKELELLKAQNNLIRNPEQFYIDKETCLESLYNNVFTGSIRLGRMERDHLIHSCFINNCQIGAGNTLINIGLLENINLAGQVTLRNIGHLGWSRPETPAEMISGNKIYFRNENARRYYIPFPGMHILDIELFSENIHRPGILQHLRRILEKKTEKHFARNIHIEHDTLIENVQIVRNTCFGPACRISGASEITDSVILSSGANPTQIGSNVIVQNSLISEGCSISSGAFLTHVHIDQFASVSEYARLYHTFLGANSHVACAEINAACLHPFHEQHHNNSFVIACAFNGQANIAAGATIGSNHNSRRPDGEIVAARGFWPGLSTSFKHNSRFAEFCLVNKADYDQEMDIPFPFTLVSLDQSGDTLQIMPAFWFRYNYYALARNAWKFKSREKRKNFLTGYVYQAIAADTVQSMRQARQLLIHQLSAKDILPDIEHFDFQNFSVKETGSLTMNGIYGKKAALIIKPVQAVFIYHSVILYWAVRQILEKSNTLSAAINYRISQEPAIRTYNWRNLGGYVIDEVALSRITNRLESLHDLDGLHNVYQKEFHDARQNALNFAFYLLETDYNLNPEEPASWLNKVENALSVAGKLFEWAYESRLKDFTNPFRKITTADEEQFQYVYGTIESDEFLKIMENELSQFKQTAQNWVKN